MTDGIRKAMCDFTGHDPIGCPWAATRDPFVARVMHAMPFFESGQLGFALPQPSARLVAGVRFYHQTSNRMFARQRELDDKEREVARKAPPAPFGKRAR